MAKRVRNGLSLFDRLVVFVAWMLSCGLVFLLGFYLGRGDRRDLGRLARRQVTFAVSPPPAEPGDAAMPKQPALTFYERLGNEPATRPPKPPPARKPPSDPKPPAVPSTTLNVRRAPTTTGLVPTVMPEASASTTTTLAPVLRGTPPPPGQKAWTVYVSPTRDRFEAEGQRSTLQARGYDAAVVRMQRDGDSWYRVRVGRYSSESNASAAQRQLRERYGVVGAFIRAE